MNKRIKIVLSIVATVLVVSGALVGVTVLQSNSGQVAEDTDYELGTYELADVKDLYGRIDYSKYDLTKLVKATADSGNMPDNIVGGSDAEVVIVEYADYQCGYCAMMNQYVKQIADEYDGKVAFAVRPYILSYHENGVAAAAAANAAAKQDVWQDYKDILFTRQDDWFYSNEEKRQQQFESYFKTATNGKGDLDKFREDMKSAEVLQKVAFDMGAGEEDEVGGTPYFYLDGKWIKNEGLQPAEYAEVLRQKINEKLKK